MRRVIFSGTSEGKTLCRQLSQAGLSAEVCVATEYGKEVMPELMIVDSIQTIATEDVDSSPGSISQVRECASAFLRFAKSSGVPVILIGHINKEGTLAGPKILEHIVDTVIQFEGDQH